MTEFGTLNLSAPLLRALEENEFTSATPIQAATIPSLIEGRDVIGLAQTGSGKTAAFVLPMLEKLQSYGVPPKPGMPRALILAPTRELARQITETIKLLARHTKFKVCTIYGGAPYRTQIHILKRGVDILVATPGRLMDHMKQRTVYLDEVGYFVLDEADRMLDMGFVDEVRKISSNIRSEHQSVLFSATLGDSIRELASTLLNQPEHIEVARQATIADNLSHKVLFVPFEDKYELLLHMIEFEKPEKALIFVRTKREADKLAGFLGATGLDAEAIHGDKKQRDRERIIRRYRESKFNFLVATDVAARGIDVKDISHVFNIDVPVEAESYVHRIGRTARGGMSGKAFTFCSKSEFNLLRAVERVIKIEIETFEGHPFPLLDTYHKAKPQKAGSRKPSKGKKGNAPKKSTKGKNRKPLRKKTAKAAAPNQAERQTADQKPKTKKPGSKPKPHKAPKKSGGEQERRTKSTDKPTAKSTGKPNRKSGGKPDNKSGGKSGNKSSSKRSSKPVRKQGGKSTQGGFAKLKRRK